MALTCETHAHWCNPHLCLSVTTSDQSKPRILSAQRRLPNPRHCFRFSITFVSIPPWFSRILSAAIGILGHYQASRHLVMSTEIVERSESAETVNAVAAPVFKQDAICKDENENMVLYCGEASSNRNCSQSYVQAYTSLTLDSLRGPKFYCFECQYSLHTLLSMITHMKMHRKPFCPICFRMYAHESEVNAHTAAVHSMLFSNAAIDPNAFVRLGEEDSCFPTEVPPNSPTQEYHQGQLELQAGLRNINNRSISFLLAQKLRKHQAAMNRGVQLEAQKLKARRAVSVDDGAVIRGAGKSRNSLRAPGKARLSGKVHKRNTSKPAAPRTATKDSEESADHSLRRLTSRFGRAISLKVPQF